ncbi:hypothetical protein M758_1G278900 [Ceratodon purpureus]|nr:hypothetical protein M758_1G278900 [Ceratodon purpureus]
MSGGGFFRGTSADQDTRFSNKMKKLLKSQKFAPELDVTIDTSKVQMDVIKPWVATRVTELLGFEDEVLINFIYGMLEEKNVDGKHVQIQLTGFMEKNTGKFMKDLWSLLISAQSNVSGIPQQFLDQKAEETRLKKIESERIAAELQRKRDLDKLADEERQREKDAAAEAARIARGAKGSADNDRDSKFSDDRRTGRGNGNFRRSVSKGRSPPGRNYRRRQRSKHSSDSSLSRSPVRSPPRRRAYSRSASRSPRRRRRSVSPDRPSRISRVVRSPMRRSYSRSPIRRRKSPPTHRSPIRRRYSRSPPARRSSSFSLSPVPRSRARSPYRRNGADARRGYRSPDRVDRPGTRERRTSVSPGFRGSKSPLKPPIVSRRPTGFGDKGIPHEVDERRAGMDREGKSSTGDKRALGDKDERKTGAPIREARDVVGEKRLYSDMEDRKTGSDRGFREKKDRWAHSDLNDEEEPQRGGRDAVGEKRLYSDMDNSRAGFNRPVRESREKWPHNDSIDGSKDTTRAVTGMPGEKRPHSEIERNTGVDSIGRDDPVEDRYYNDNGRRAEDRSGTGKREMDTRKSVVEKEDRYFSDRRDRPIGRHRSPLPERQQAFKDTRGVRKTVDSSQSPVRERRREDHGRRSIELDNDDSDVVRENLSKKSRIQEAEDGVPVREDDQESLSPRGSDERRKEEKRRRKEEKRLRREERHKRKKEEKQKRKDEKRAVKAGTTNGEDKRNRALLSPEGMDQSDEEHSEHDQKQERKDEKRAPKAGVTNGEDRRDRALRSPDEMEQSDEEHSEYDQKQLEDTLRQKALESMRAMKAISH